MTKRVFDTGYAPVEESQIIRELLSNAGIRFYETPRGNWGLSMAAIWVENDKDADRARVIIENYQAQITPRPPDSNKLKIDWKLLPWSLLLVLLLFTMLGGWYVISLAL